MRVALWCVLLAACGGGEQAQPAPIASTGAESRSEPRVIAGTCDTSWLPEGTTRDVADASLASEVRAWLGGEGSRIVASRTGIVFAKSEDDRGDDPPHPPEAAALAARACGLGARWLVDHLRARLSISAGPDGDGVTCDDDVCCVRGMEFVPNATVVFRRDAEREVWEVTTALLVNEAALTEETIARNRRFAADAVQRLEGRTCEGEPWLVR
ncbi:hypothetical protein [Sandaracinus amylolyticus]|uniref:hypothetical protein n=1 Tax=Sandaracinus amylolyticus TaxID=927083 RepID=UPI001F25D0A2|nr:hypothetical protein [Sandaracinus amylolyticus]UJR78421.1 Hypothetical protein I5071_4480 [Sandaracinus amylolyticus]